MSLKCLRAGGRDLKENQSKEDKVSRTALEGPNVEPPEERPPIESNGGGVRPAETAWFPCAPNPGRKRDLTSNAKVVCII